MNDFLDGSIKIAVDFDGVCVKTQDLICHLINYKTNKNYSYKDIISWDFWEREGLNKEFYEAYDLMDSSRLRLSLESYDNHLLDSLRDINYNYCSPFDILTCNDDHAAESISDWFWNFPEYNVPEFKIKCLGRKTAKEKLELDYLIFIDDNPEMAEQIMSYSDKFLCLANAPWNKHIKNSNNVKRFESWKEVPELINNIIQNSNNKYNAEKHQEFYP